MFDDIVTRVALYSLIPSVHYALLILKHRADIGPRLRASALKGLKADPSPDEKKLALRLIKAIEKKEQKPIERLSRDRVADYVKALAGIVESRVVADPAFDPARGERLLETLRDP